jgi:thiamine biosynthesis lipoprotein
MGTTVEVYADDASEVDATRVLFAEIEAVCSRFLETSELSAINRRSSSTVTVSTVMRQVLEAASEVRRRTGGLVDPAVGARVVDWGYDRSFELIGDIGGAPADRAIGGWELSGSRLHLDPDVMIDLGGIAKGWTCDQAVDRGIAAVVNAGGDIRSQHSETEAEILDGADVVAATVRLGIGALATSSVSRRRWSAGGVSVHHVIDPRTGAPAVSPVVSASAVARDAASAEAGAKAALILGTEGLAWLDRQDWLDSGLVIWHDGSVYATTTCVVAA